MQRLIIGAICERQELACSLDQLDLLVAAGRSGCPEEQKLDLLLVILRRRHCDCLDDARSHRPSFRRLTELGNVEKPMTDQKMCNILKEQTEALETRHSLVADGSGFDPDRSR